MTDSTKSPQKAAPKSAPKKATAEKPKKAADKSAAPKAAAKKPVEKAGRVRIIIRAFDHRIIDDTAKTIVEHAEKSGAVVAGPVPLPTKIRKYTVLRSTFKHKDARDQFESRTHKRLIDLSELAPNTLPSLKSLSVPAGVDIEIKMLV